MVTAVPLNHTWSYDVVGAAVARGHEALTGYWQGGGAERAARARRWHRDSAPQLHQALHRPRRGG